MDRFRGKYGTPTHDQHAYIGRIVSSLSVLDKTIQSLIGRLCGSSAYLSSAVSDGLNFNGKTEALGRLIAIHRQQVGILSAPLCDKLDNFRKALDRVRQARNQFAHLVWMRQADDAIVGFKLLAAPAKPGKDDSVVRTNPELIELAKQVDVLIGEGIDLDADLLPFARSIFDQFYDP